jgi:hypothetical protein
METVTRLRMAEWFSRVARGQKQSSLLLSHLSQPCLPAGRSPSKRPKSTTFLRKIQKMLYSMGFLRPYRLTVRTEPSQGLNRGSIPRRVMPQTKHLHLIAGALFVAYDCLWQESKLRVRRHESGLYDFSAEKYG